MSNKRKKEFPFNPNDEIELDIVSLSSEGQGVGRYDGVAVFVPFALPGERAIVKITRLMNSYAEAKLIRLISTSANRVMPACDAYGSCGACSLMHMNYQAQLEAKRIQVRDAMERIGGFRDIDVLPTIGMDDELRYRNKASFPFGMKNGKVVFGCFAQKSHNLIPVSDCLIQSKTAIVAMQTICDWANEHGISAYGDNLDFNSSHNAILRHGVVRCTHGGTMIVIVTVSRRFPHADKLIEMLKVCIPNLKTVIHNVNPNAASGTGGASSILGKRNSILYDTIAPNTDDKNNCGSVIEELAGLRFKVSAESFLQVNPVQTIKLYSTAIDALELKKTDNVIDLYCGIGTISLLIAGKVHSVLGIETVAAAIEDAKENARLNGIDNAEFICGEVESILPKLLSKTNAAEGSWGFIGKSKTRAPFADALVLDPPRKGAERSALDAINKSRIPRLAYVSCNPATLARDCKILCDAGYRIRSIQPVDMFPETHHVETVCLLSRK